MRTLNSLLRKADERTGVSEHNKSFEKIIKCSRCGTSYRVPGYTIDYVCQCKRKVTELDATKLVGNMANLQRNYMIKTEARDAVIPTAPHAPEEATNKKNVV